MAVPCYFTSFCKIVLCKHRWSGKDAVETKFHKTSSRAVKPPNYYKPVYSFIKQDGMQDLQVAEEKKNFIFWCCAWEYQKIEPSQLILDFKYLLPYRIFLLTGLHLPSPLQSKGSSSFQSKRKEHNAESVICYRWLQPQHACEVLEKKSCL